MTITITFPFSFLVISKMSDVKIIEKKMAELKVTDQFSKDVRHKQRASLSLTAPVTVRSTPKAKTAK